MTATYARLVRAAIIASTALSLALIAGCGGSKDAVGVNAVSADPMAFSGTITVKGVVQNVDPSGPFVVLIDEEEYASCGLNPCGGTGIIPLHLPIDGQPSSAGSVYEGDLPDIEDFVVVVGEIKSLPDGIVFDVHRMERSGATLLARQ